ncbi:MAG TPA: HAD hydrolase family protein [Candidatus Binatia bacterium]|nr:HAD hydrolase family protein [Candidatus Binatia bacterium]
MKRLPASLRNKAKKIKLLLLDVDGVLTDGRIIIDDRGVESKHFHVRDGQGIALLLGAGIDVGFISARSSRAVSRRAEELGVRAVYQGVADKVQTYNEIKRRRRLRDEEIAYIGDDIGDLGIFQQAGLAVSVADACRELALGADMVTAAPGGKGAVREVAELLLKAQRKWLSF